MKSQVRMAIAAASLIAVSVSGCAGLLGRGGSSSQYQITSNQKTYRRGNTGEAVIRNISDERLSYNLCPRRLERQQNKYWLVAYEWPTAGGACTTEERQLDKGASVTTLFEIPTGVPAGMYRVLFTGLKGKDGRTVGPDQAATQSFEVR